MSRRQICGWRSVPLCPGWGCRRTGSLVEVHTSGWGCHRWEGAGVVSPCPHWWSLDCTPSLKHRHAVWCWNSRKMLTPAGGSLNCSVLIVGDFHKCRYVRNSPSGALSTVNHSLKRSGWFTWISSSSSRSRMSFSVWEETKDLVFLPKHPHYWNSDFFSFPHDLKLKWVFSWSSPGWQTAGDTLFGPEDPSSLQWWAAAWVWSLKQQV